MVTANPQIHGRIGDTTIQTYINTQVSGSTLAEIRSKAQAEITRFFPADVLKEVTTSWSIGSINPVPNTPADGDAVKYVAQISCTVDIS